MSWSEGTARLLLEGPGPVLVEPFVLGSAVDVVSLQIVLAAVHGGPGHAWHDERFARQCWRDKCTGVA